MPDDYDTRDYPPRAIVTPKLVKVTNSKLPKKIKGKKVGDPIPPSMEDGVHYRWDGCDFIVVVPNTGGPWLVGTIANNGIPFIFNAGGL